MTYNFKKLPGSVIDVAVELSKEEFAEYFNRIYEDVLAKVEIKGFRPGTAPRELAERAIDKNRVQEQAIGEAIRHGLNEVVKENEWIVIDKPEAKVLSLTDGLKYSGKLVLFPEIKLPDYKKIAQKEMAAAENDVGAIKINDDDISKSLDWLRESRAIAKMVNRGAQKGDAVDINLKVYVDGRSLTNADNQRDRFVLGKGHFFPGFEGQLIGREANQSLKFSLTAPADYWREDLQGKELNFEVKINSVLERRLPTANDEFARNLGKFQDLAALKDSIKDGLFQERKIKGKEKARVRILEEISARSEIDPPQIMVDKILDNLVKEARRAPYRAESSGMGPEAVRSQLEKAARQKVITQLVIYKIAELENLKPTEKELEEERAKVDNHKFHDYIYDVLQSRKVFEFLERQ